MIVYKILRYIGALLRALGILSLVVMVYYMFTITRHEPIVTQLVFSIITIPLGYYMEKYFEKKEGKIRGARIRAREKEENHTRIYTPDRSEDFSYSPILPVGSNNVRRYNAESNYGHDSQWDKSQFFPKNVFKS